jgi:hypothetical protein
MRRLQAAREMLAPEVSFSMEVLLPSDRHETLEFGARDSTLTLEPLIPVNAEGPRPSLSMTMLTVSSLPVRSVDRCPSKGADDRVTEPPPNPDRDGDAFAFRSRDSRCLS